MEDPTTIALNLTFFGTLGLAFVMFVGLFVIFVATLLIAGAGRLATVLVMALFGRLPKEDTVEIVRLTSPLSSSAGSSSDDGVPAAQPVPPDLEEQQRTGEQGVNTPRTPSLIMPSLTKWTERLSSRFQSSLRDAVERLPLVQSVLHSVRPNPAEMSPDWAAAVARADARAKERARAEAPALGAPQPVLGAPVLGAPVLGAPQPTQPVLGAPLPEAGVSVNELPARDLQAIQLTRIAPLVESTMVVESSKKAPSGSEPRSFVKPRPPGYEALLDTGSLVSLAARTGKSAIRK